MACSIDWKPSLNSSALFVDVPVSCGNFQDTVRVLKSEKSLELRIYSDVTFFEVFFQQGRTAMTVSSDLHDTSDYILTSPSQAGWVSRDVVVEEAVAWSIGSPWVSPEDVRNSPRIYK